MSGNFMSSYPILRKYAMDKSRIDCNYVGSLFIDKVRVGEKFDVNIRFNLIITGWINCGH